MRVMILTVLSFLLSGSMTANSAAPTSGSAVDEKVLEATRQTALRGDNEARIDMGLASEDRNTQMYWFGLAARDGNRTAQHNLASVYQSMGDALKAVYWWKKAASAGDPDAARHVAMAYKIGEGVTKNSELEYVWWHVAAGLGVQDCEHMLTLRNQLTPKAIERAKRHASKILSKTGTLPADVVCQ
jgi:uncharacterized protein